VATATQTLSSALSGAGALFGHDSAGLVFGQGYTHSGQALLDAAESAVNACRRVGFGVQMSASNYGKANAASTVGGGESPVPVPTEPPCFGGLTMPPPMGGGVAAPLGWSLVEQFVGEVGVSPRSLGIFLGTAQLTGRNQLLGLCNLAGVLDGADAPS